MSRTRIDGITPHSLTIGSFRGYLPIMRASGTHAAVWPPSGPPPGRASTRTHEHRRPDVERTPRRHEGGTSLRAIALPRADLRRRAALLRSRTRLARRARGAAPRRGLRVLRPAREL